MSNPKLDSCFCFSLRTGTLIIGILSIISPVIVISLVAMINEDLLEDRMKTERVVIIAIASIMLFFSILLFLGTITKKPLMMTPWLVFNMLITVIYIYLWMCKMFVLLTAGFRQLALIYFLGNAISIVIGIYFWLVVKTHYEELKEDLLKGQTDFENN